MRVLVTGALGHIGSRLIRELPTARPGVEIVMVDDMSTQRYASLFELPTTGSYRFVEASILDTPLEPLVRGCDAVVHLAAITNAAGSFALREKVENDNFLGTKRVAEACAAAGVPLLFLSTTSVYGTQKDEVDENCSAAELKPQSPYAETKLREEAYLRSLAKLKFTACRFGTIFGVSPGMRFHTAVNKFCWQAVMGQPVTVWRTALDQVRPYLDLGDAVRAIRFIVDKKLFSGETYNVLTLNASVREIIEAIRARVPALEVKYVDEAIMNQLSYKVSCRKFESTGFAFQGDFRRAIAETIDRLAGANAGTVLGAAGAKCA